MNFGIKKDEDDIESSYFINDENGDMKGILKNKSPEEIVKFIYSNSDELEISSSLK